MACLLGTVLLPLGPAWADRPLVSETADVIPERSCQVEAALARARAARLPAGRGGDVLFSCSLDAGTQAALGYTRDSVEGLTAEAARMAGKSTLVAPEGGQFGLGIAYGLSAAKAPGEGWRFDDFSLLGVVTKELALGLLGHANLGFSRSRIARQSTTVWSLGLETTADLTLAADVFGDDRSKPWVSAGVGYSFGAGFSANLAYAVQFDQPRLKQISIGAKLVF
jgi:hypothetical protein